MDPSSYIARWPFCPEFCTLVLKEAVSVSFLPCFFWRNSYGLLWSKTVKLSSRPHSLLHFSFKAESGLTFWPSLRFGVASWLGDIWEKVLSFIPLKRLWSNESGDLIIYFKLLSFYSASLIKCGMPIPKYSYIGLSSFVSIFWDIEAGCETYIFIFCLKTCNLEKNCCCLLC